MLHLLIPLTGGVGLALHLTALVSTHVLHGLSWAAAVALLTRGGRCPASTRSWMWRMALFGPLLTTMLSAASAPDATASIVGPAAVSPAAASVLQQGEAASAYWLGDGFWRWLVVAGAAALLLGLARFARAAWRVSTTLRGTRPSADRRSQRLLDGLLLQTRLTRVRLTESLEITSPLSVGLREICLPKRLLDGMSEAEAEAVLAHELAHLERRDGLWFPAVAFVEAVLWMSPLTRWVASRTRYCSELACDDRAVALTKKPQALARALAHVAEKQLERQRFALLPSMAGSSGAVLRRVKRLVSADAGSASPVAARGSRWAIAGLAMTGCSLSAVSLGLPEGERPAPRATASIASPHAAPSAKPAPDKRAIEREIVALELGAREAQVELDALSPESERSSSAPPPRLLELEQKLRHAREMRAFLEAELHAPMATSEQDAPR
jgi:beta-lactamase regulating signal transducer with metallopeptidase domain